MMERGAGPDPIIALAQFLPPAHKPRAGVFPWPKCLFAPKVPTVRVVWFFYAPRRPCDHGSVCQA